MATALRLDNRGEVFTKRWVVGYSPEHSLAGHTIVEPSCGTGAFLGPIVDRLLKSIERHEATVGRLGGCIRAFDISDENVTSCRFVVTERLGKSGTRTGVGPGTRRDVGPIG